MRAEALRDALALAGRLRHVFVATADAAGRPHLAAAGALTSAGENRVAVGAWFCPGTLANLAANPRLAVVVWDAEADVGHQLVGEAEGVEDLAMMDGYERELETRGPLPQTQRRILMRVQQVTGFTHAPHSDVEE
jgi:uncharacterized protein